MTTIDQTIAEFTKAATEKIERNADELKTIGVRLFDIEQKSSRAVPGMGGSLPNGLSGRSATPGAQVADNAAVLDLASGRTKNTATILLRDGVGLLRTKAAITGATFPGEAQRLGIVGNDPRRPLRLLDVLASTPMTQATAQYIQLGAYTNAAGYQIAQGDAKPEASLPFTLKTVEAATIAHWVAASEQVLADAPMLSAQIDGLLLFGLADKLEREIINGAGTPGTIAGLATVAMPFVGAGAPADRIGQAGAALQGAGWQPSVVVLSPADWFAIASERTAQGYVASSGWNMPAAPNVWGMQVVVSSAQANGNALVLDAAQVAILDRQSAKVDVGYTGDQFTHNMLTIRAELRAALAVYAPSAVASVALA